MTIRSRKPSHLVLDIPCRGRVYRFFLSDSKSATARLTRRVDQLSRESPSSFVFHCVGWEAGLTQLST